MWRGKEAQKERRAGGRMRKKEQVRGRACRWTHSVCVCACVRVGDGERGDEGRGDPQIDVCVCVCGREREREGERGLTCRWSRSARRACISDCVYIPLVSGFTSSITSAGGSVAERERERGREQERGQMDNFFPQT